MGKIVAPRTPPITDTGSKLALSIRSSGNDDAAALGNFMTSVRVEPAACEFPTWGQSFGCFERQMCHFRSRLNPQRFHVAISLIAIVDPLQLISIYPACMCTFDLTPRFDFHQLFNTSHFFQFKSRESGDEDRKAEEKFV